MTRFFRMRLEVRRILLVTGPSFSSPIYKKNKIRGYLSYLVMLPKVKKGPINYILGTKAKLFQEVTFFIVIFTYLKTKVNIYVQNGHAVLNRLVLNVLN